MGSSGSGRKMVRGSWVDWAAFFSTNMRSSSAATGGIRSVPLAVCYSYWGRAYRSAPPGLPREARVEGPQDSGETLMVEDESSSIYLL